MRRENYLRPLLLALMPLLLLLAACGGGGGPSTAPAGAPLPGRQAGELRLFGADPITLDPALATEVASAGYIVELFSGLVTFDQNLQIAPDIAERWEVSDDGRTYTFHIRRGVIFSDGSRQVTARDVKYSLERALNRRTGSTVAMSYLGDIVGAREYRAGQASEVSGIQVVDDYTLRITIDAPKTYFLAKLTYPVAFVVKREQVEANPRGWTRQPVGTGPFRLREWRLGERIVLEPNPHYYLEPKPALSRVTFLLAGGSPLISYENGEVDIAPVGLNDIERVRDPRDPLSREFQQVDELSTFYIGFNVRKPPLDDVRVRQALAMAIDKQALASVVLRDLVRPAIGVLPPGMPGYNPNLQGLPFDPQRARQLLDQAGGPSRLAGLTLLSSGVGGTPGPIIDAIVAMWEQNLGVRIEVRLLDFGTFLTEVDRGNFDLFSLGWIADYVDPENFLDILFHSGSDNNHTRYANPQVDRLLEQARVEQDQNRRYALYQQAEQIVVQDAPWIPLYHSRDSYVVKPYVRGYSAAPFVVPRLRFVSLQR